MFTPYPLRGMTLVNRVVVAPMDMYCAEDGTPGDFHLVHLGARALGGAGLDHHGDGVRLSRSTDHARVRGDVPRSEHVAAWQRVVEFVHRHSEARICLQLGHAGPKGSTRLPWQGSDVALDDDPWEVIAPSAVRYAPTLQMPRAMTRADMDRVRADFVNATRMALDAGFDMIELHCAHGYLLSSFITPLANQRADEYGGSIENRVRYPLEVFGAMRAAWPVDRPMSVRISATDWVEDGMTGDDAVVVARAFADAGVDIVHVSTGQTSVDARPVYGRMYQTPFSDQVRNDLGIPTIAVGNITQPDQVNSIIAAGRADLCALARPHLSDPFWTLHAAAELGYAGQSWPPQYLTGKKQLERELSRKAGDAMIRPQHFGWTVEGRVATITLNRPERKNPLTFESYAELTATFRTLVTTKDIRALVLTGAGGNFCSGGDVHEIIGPLVAMRDQRDREGLLRFTRMTGDLVSAMRACPQPIIAAVDGVCAGAGAILAMASDLRLGTARSKVAFLFVRVGLSGADMGACAILPRIIGQGRASELLYTGRVMDGAEAERWGFYNRLVTAEALSDEAAALARSLAEGPAFAHAMTKKCLHLEWDMGVDEAIAAEAEAQAECMQTEDFARAYRAFVAKQPAVFEGD